MRPKELKAQLALQKASGGTQISNVGMGNIFGAGQSYEMGKLYKDIYGKGGQQPPKIMFPWG